MLNGMNWGNPNLTVTASDFGKTNTPLSGYYGSQIQYPARLQFSGGSLTRADGWMATDIWDNSGASEGPLPGCAARPLHVQHQSGDQFAVQFRLRFGKVVFLCRIVRQVIQLVRLECSILIATSRSSRKS